MPPVRTFFLCALCLFAGRPATADVTRAECIGLLVEAGRLQSEAVIAEQEMGAAIVRALEDADVIPGESPEWNALLSASELNAKTFEAWDRVEEALGALCRDKI